MDSSDYSKSSQMQATAPGVIENPGKPELNDLGLIDSPTRPRLRDFPPSHSRHYFGLILICTYAVLSAVLMGYAVFAGKDGITTISAAVLAPLATIVSAVIGFYFGSGANKKSNEE